MVVESLIHVIQPPVNGTESRNDIHVYVCDVDRFEALELALRQNGIRGKPQDPIPHHYSVGRVAAEIEKAITPFDNPKIFDVWVPKPDFLCFRAVLDNTYWEHFNQYCGRKHA